jgi:hypothetical protein
MIASSRIDQAQNEVIFADGIAAFVRGETHPQAVAAGRLLAETVIMWRVIMNSKLQR